MSQGILPFQYEVDPVNSGLTALAGLPAYLDFAAVSGLTHSIKKHLTVNSNKQQGWTDEQIVMSLVLLNLAGGESVGENNANVRFPPPLPYFGIYQLFITQTRNRNANLEKLLYPKKMNRC
jgi:hypothetical protein